MLDLRQPQSGLYVGLPCKPSQRSPAQHFFTNPPAKQRHRNALYAIAIMATAFVCNFAYSEEYDVTPNYAGAPQQAPINRNDNEKSWSCATSDRAIRTIRLCSQLIRDNTTAKPKRLFALLKRAKAWTVEEEYHSAVHDYSEALKIRPSDSKAMSARAEVYLTLKEYDNAKRDYTRLIESDKQNVTAYCRRGFAHLRLKQHQSAMDDYSQALRIDPSRLDCVVGRGKVFEDLGQHKQAFQAYTAAIAANERYWEAYFQRAALYLKLDQKHAAIADYSRVLQLDFLNLRAAKSLKSLGVVTPDF